MARAMRPAAASTQLRTPSPALVLPAPRLNSSGSPKHATTLCYEKDTVNVGPGERYDVIWQARGPGKWLLHCHILHHTTNNNVEERGGGGLTMVINVTP